MGSRAVVFMLHDNLELFDRVLLYFSEIVEHSHGKRISNRADQSVAPTESFTKAKYLAIRTIDRVFGIMEVVAFPNGWDAETKSSIVN